MNSANNHQSPGSSAHLTVFPPSSSSKSDITVRAAAEWRLSNTIEIDDADITFDGRPLSALFEDTRHSFEYQIRDDIQCSQRGRKSRRD